MEDYSYLNGILVKKDSTYQEFQEQLIKLAVEQQTYLNLFLVAVVSYKGQSPDFDKYIHLLTHFRERSGKKSADINYIGYKDRKNILMHAAIKCSPQAVQTLLSYPLVAEVTDPFGKNAAFYAVRHPNEEYANANLTLILNRHPKLLNTQAANGATLLHEAVEVLRPSIIELLLRRGSNPNSKLRDNGNSVSHELLKFYQNNKETVLSVLMLLAKYKANFEEPNHQGLSVSELALKEGIHFQDYASFCALLEREESQNDYDFDKNSLTTLNPPTKAGDTRSEIYQSDSHAFSGRVDFSELDELNPPDYPQDPSLSYEEEEISNFQQQPHQINFQELSEQITVFSHQQEQIYISMIPMAEQFFAALDKIVSKYHLGIEVVGSFATGLWSSRSDINVSLVPRTNEFINFEATLQKIYKVFKSRKPELEIADIFFNKSKISSIKITLNEKYNNQLFQIAIFHRNHLNQQYAAYILESLAVFPEIKALFFVYQRMCLAFGLHDRLTGGLKTYALFMMIYSVVKSMPTKNIGELFYHIALYYGFYFQYSYDLENLNQKEEILEWPKMKLDLIDPLNHKNNIGGKSTKAQNLQNMFRSIYYWLSQPATAPYLPQLFQLSNIF